jgi:hypothetical protein
MEPIMVNNIKIKRWGKWQDCKKAWILPSGKTVLFCEYCHRDHIVNFCKEYSKKFGLVLPKVLDDTSVRKSAIECGFTRINYQFNHGLLTIETLRKNWNKVTKKSLVNFINKNANLIDVICVHLFDDWENYTEHVQNVADFKNSRKSKFIPQ